MKLKAATLFAYNPLGRFLGAHPNDEISTVALSFINVSTNILMASNTEPWGLPTTYNTLASHLVLVAIKSFFP